jgi:hypothetical protein
MPLPKRYVTWFAQRRAMAIIAASVCVEGDERDERKKRGERDIGIGRWDEMR